MAKRVLIVDDDPNALRLIGYTLEQEGFEILTAADGHEALEVAQRELPDLIILDIMMPSMAGFETCLRLREIPITSHIPILVLTAKAQEADQILSFKAGADEYLAKPAAPDEIVAKVNQLIKKD
ncbi:MAG: response regulator transcription factor [Anaerolineae bacterium]